MTLSCILTGCLGYKAGPQLPEGVKRVHVKQPENISDEPRLAIYAASKIRNAIVTNGNLLLEDKHPDANMQIRIIRYTIQPAGTAKLKSDDDTQEVFGTTIFRANVAMTVTLIDPYTKKKIYGPKSFTGKAEYTDLVDLNVVRQDALRLAMADAAKKIVDELTNVWIPEVQESIRPDVKELKLD